MDIFTQHRTTLITGVTIGITLLLGGVWYWNRSTSLDGDESQAPSEQGVALDLSGVTATSGPVKKEGYTIEMVPAEKKLPNAPSLIRVIPETPTLGTEARAALLTNLSKTAELLRANPASYGDWIDLGALRQMLGDYTGAVEAWNYAAILSPSTGVAYANLGNLYAHYVQDFPKAEANYLKGIAYDPRAVNTYRNLFDLYVYSYKQNTSAAEDILKSGIAKLPKAVDLQVLLARYYRDRGRTTDAKTVYETAIATAEVAGNTALAAELRSEMAALQ